MSGCCPHACDAGRLFSRFARRYRRRFERRGLEKSQEQLVAGVERAGIRGASLLEIGCGVGYLHQTLLEAGAASAVGVDLSDRMLEQARELAERRGLSDRTAYRHGDFMLLADELDAADVTILDKVICCYPDADGLVQRSLARTGRVYAFTVPRNRWFVHFGAAIGAFFLWLIRSSFRSYVHDPGHIEAQVRQHGFRKAYENVTPVWLTQVYVREAPAPGEDSSADVQGTNRPAPPSLPK